VKVAVCILAKDESEKIARTLAGVARQTCFSDTNHNVELHVVANGCTDDTVEASRRAFSIFVGANAKPHVHDLNPGGKSRAWNRAVHELVCDKAEVIVFADADIAFVDENVISELLVTLHADPGLVVSTGFPIKDVSVKVQKTVVDRFSLAVSDRTRHVGAICGQLYAIRANHARQIWLPDETPGEDGFLNAMVITNGFSKPAEWGRIAMLDRPTHYYESLRPSEFVTHERRLIVGTIINRWIFEHFWSLRLQSPAGPLINEWNRTDPNWVERIIRQNAADRAWLIPNAILFGRFKNTGARSMWRNVANLLQASAATAFTLAPAIMANLKLKRAGAAKSW